MNIGRMNNFDLVRLAAAAQVVIWHAIEHFQIETNVSALWLLGSFPGVPIFFVVSGYLIASAYERNRSTVGYFSNRALRLLPGLWMCFLLTSLSIYFLHGFSGAKTNELWVWTISSLMGFSFTPTFLKNYGTGAVNGSLWTIPVEIQFYLVCPILLKFLGERTRR